MSVDTPDRTNFVPYAGCGLPATLASLCRYWEMPGEHLELATFCSGLGKMWAERRTTVTSSDQEDACVEAVSLWVHLDPESWRPVPFSEAEVAALVIGEWLDENGSFDDKAQAARALEAKLNAFLRRVQA